MCYAFTNKDGDILQITFKGVKVLLVTETLTEAAKLLNLMEESKVTNVVVQQIKIEEK